MENLSSFKISSKILPIPSYLFADIWLQDWTLFFADIVFTCDNFHSTMQNW